MSVTISLGVHHLFSYHYYIVSMPSGKRPFRTRRRKPSSKLSKYSRKSSRQSRRRGSKVQYGSGVFDSIFSSKWLNWLDKKKDPEEDKKPSDLADNKQEIMNKLDAELASIQAKYPEIPDVKPSTLPLTVETTANREQVGRGRPNKRRNRSRLNLIRKR